MSTRNSTVQNMGRAQRRRGLPIGTRSLLYGAHQVVIHPIFVGIAWVRLYGFTWDPRVWLAIVIHDWGYWGLPNMDGPEGDTHVEWAARVMGRLFGPEWRDFCLYHSRFYARRDAKPFSPLCVADKLATALEPAWLYLPRVILTGEIKEFMSLANGNNGSKYQGEPNSPYVTAQLSKGTIIGWFRGMTGYLREWVETHKDGRDDMWTPAARVSES